MPIVPVNSSSSCPVEKPALQQTNVATEGAKAAEASQPTSSSESTSETLSQNNEYTAETSPMSTLNQLIKSTQQTSTPQANQKTEAGEPSELAPFVIPPKVVY